MTLLPEAKTRAKTLVELADNLAFLFRDPHCAMTPKARRLLDRLGLEAQARLGALAYMLDELAVWDEEALEGAVRAFAEREGVGLGKIAQPLRAALTGADASPGIFAVMAALGREETLLRVNAIAIIAAERKAEAEG